MEYYLSTFEGDGSRANPFKPRGNIPGWTMIDLRPDSSVVSGLCVLALPSRNDLSGMTYIGNDLVGAIPPGVFNQFQNRLGLTLIRQGSNKLPAAIYELLVDHARQDGTRWKPLMPERRLRRWRIYLGREMIYDAPMVGGGTTLTETWTAADSVNLTADLTWTEGGGVAWGIASNKANNDNDGVASYSTGRATSEVSTQNHYVQVQLITFNRVSAALQAYVIARMADEANFDGYTVYAKDSAATLTWELSKIVGGSETPLESDAQDPALNDTFRSECDGSSISGKVNSITILGPVTDTALSGATRVRGGIAGYSDGNNADVIELDNWEMGDLSTNAFANLAWITA